MVFRKIERERVFIVSIRKDIDTGLFEFPKPFPLKRRSKDMLEDEVDEKFYLSEKMTNYLFTITEKNKARGNGNVYKASDPDGIAKTITTREGARVKDNFIEMLIVNEATKKGYAEAFEGDSVNLEHPNSKTRRGREIKIVSENMRIRKLTPKECWRLMGFSDEDFERAEKVNSNSQLYKQAGNSIVVDVLEELFCMMLDEDGKIFV